MACAGVWGRNLGPGGDLLAIESAAPPRWELVRAYRRLEARGEVRGGRFVAGVAGERGGGWDAV